MASTHLDYLKRIEAPPDASLHDVAKMAVPQLVTLLMARSTEVMHR